MQPVDVWAYTNPSESIDAYQALMETHRAVTGGGISSWGYRNPSETVDAYYVINETNKNVKELMNGCGVEIDYNRLAAAVADGIADAVADKLAARLKE